MSKIRAIDFSIHSDEEIAAFLATVDDAQIERLNAAIENVNKVREEQKIVEMRAEMEEIAKKYGTTFSEAFSGKITNKVSPKYRSEDGKSEWTGRGRQPIWIATHQEKHGNLDALLITKKEEIVT
jgi:DNA-binding protein H-NS